MNQWELEVNALGAKRGKTRATKSRLVLVLHLIGWEDGASILNQSQSVVYGAHILLRQHVSGFWKQFINMQHIVASQTSKWSCG